MTTTAQRLIEQWQDRLDRNKAKVEAESDPVKRAVLTGWVDATELALAEFEQDIAQIESDAFLVPADEGLLVA